MTIAFTIMMALGGSSAALFGKFIERSVPRKSAMMAAILFSLGQAGSGLTVSLDSFNAFLAFLWASEWFGTSAISHRFLP